MNFSKYISLISLFSLPFPIFAQTTINVPSDYPTIQLGLNAAESSDTVRVQPGTYFENITWPDVPNITLIGDPTGDKPVIDGGGLGSVIVVLDSTFSIIDTNTHISNMTIRNGHAQNGGGVLVDAAGISITNSSIWENTADSRGGGIYLSSHLSALILSDVQISENQSNNSGGGMYAAGGSIILNGVDFLGNRAESQGGGLYVINVNLTYRYGRIVGNQTKRDLVNFTDDGGGMLIFSSTALLSHLQIRENTSALVGGLRALGNIRLEHTEISNNTGGGGGGGEISGTGIISDVYVIGNIATNGLGGGLAIYGNVEVKRTFIFKNRAASHGGGLLIDGDPVTLDSVYIYKNDARGWGGGISTSARLTLKNSIIYGNRARVGGGIDFHFGPSKPALLQNVLISHNQATQLIEFDGYSISNQPVFAGGIHSYSDSLIIENSTISFNTTTANIGGVRVLGDGSNLNLSWSNIYNNGKGLTLEPEAGFVYIEDNWWGDSTGPYHQSLNPSGEGDSIAGISNLPSFKVAPNPQAPINPPERISLVEETSEKLVLRWEYNGIAPPQGYRIFFSTDTVSGIYPYEKFDSSTTTTFLYKDTPFDEVLKVAVATIAIDGRESFPSAPYEVLRSSLTILEADAENIVAEKLHIAQNYPNPFNPITTIRFDLPEAMDMSIMVYDIMGREVIRLAQGRLEPGFHEVIWNGRTASEEEIPSGIYIARLVTPDYSNSIKMVLLK